MTDANSPASPPPALPDAPFLGVIALELRDGMPPRNAALDAQAAGALVALLGRDLASWAPGTADCDLTLMAAHFDPAEVLRPEWPLHRRVVELAQRAPGKTQAPRMIAFGADAGGDVPMPLRCDPNLAGGGLRVLPFVLRGEAAATAGTQLEELLLDRGMASADAALALQEGLGASVEHVRYLSVLDLAAITAMQYQNVGLEPLWTLIEAALLDADIEDWLDAPPEPLAHYVDGEVRIALMDPCAWHKRNAPDETDGDRLEHGFELFQARQRQFAAILDAHGVPVQFVHCADGGSDCLR